MPSQIHEIYQRMKQFAPMPSILVLFLSFGTYTGTYLRKSCIACVSLGFLLSNSFGYGVETSRMQRWLWTVHLLVSSLIFFWIKLSIVVSTDAVASSNTRIFLLCSKTLTKQTSCLCPTLQFSPSSATHALRSPLSYPIQSLQDDTCSTPPRFLDLNALLEDPN